MAGRALPSAITVGRCLPSRSATSLQGESPFQGRVLVGVVPAPYSYQVGRTGKRFSSRHRQVMIAHPGKPMSRKKRAIGGGRDQPQGLVSPLRSTTLLCFLSASAEDHFISDHIVATLLAHRIVFFPHSPDNLP